MTITASPVQPSKLSAPTVLERRLPTTHAASQRAARRAATPVPVEICWKSVYFGETSRLDERLTAMANRRFSNTADAGAAFNFAFHRISADGWLRLRRGFRSRCAPANYLRGIFASQLEEYAMRKYGRRRPPVWVSRKGEPWDVAYELLSLKRMPAETIVDWLCARGAHAPEEIRAVIATLRARIPTIGQYLGEYPTDLTAVPTDAPVEDSPAHAVENDEARMLRRILKDVVFSKRRGRTSARHPAWAAQLCDAFDVTELERAILRLVYGDGLSVAATARNLALPEHKTRRLHSTLLARFADSVRQVGMHA